MAKVAFARGSDLHNQSVWRCFAAGRQQQRRPGVEYNFLCRNNNHSAMAGGHRLDVTHF
jgi:hypothetical protein